MADLTSVCDALTAILDAIPGLRASSGFTSQVNPPQAIVMPQPGQHLRFDSFGGGVSYILRVVLLTTYGQDTSSVALLNSYLATSGPSSISAAIQAAQKNAAWECIDMDSSRGYGLMDWAGQTYLGTQIPVTVMAT